MPNLDRFSGITPSFGIGPIVDYSTKCWCGKVAEHKNEGQEVCGECLRIIWGIDADA